MRRAFQIAICFLVLFIVVIGRLAYISLIQGDELKALADDQRTRSLDYYQYARGDFIDTLGRPLTGIEENCLVVFPAMLDDTTTVAAALAEILAIDADAVLYKLNEENRQSLSPYILKTGLDAGQSETVTNLGLDGVLVLPLAARYSAAYPAVHLLGMVAPSDEQGVYHGISGLEYQYDQYLSGRQDKEVSAYVDVSGQISTDNLYLVVPEQTRYANVELTINLDYQQIAERAMKDYSGACVILDPDNGDILAAVSAPAYDPYSWSALLADDVYVNKAFSLYPPASTFKIVLAAAALELGVTPRAEYAGGGNNDATGDSGENDGSSDTADNSVVFNCDGAYTLAEGYDVACWQEEGHGKLDLEGALINSCNCYFVGLGLALGGDTIKEYADRFGLTEQKIIGYELPDTTHIDFSSYIDGDVANASIGERGVRISPLQSAAMLAICINGGYLPTPRLVKGIYDCDGRLIKDYPSQPGQRAIPETIANELKAMLVEAVNSGTAVNAEGSYIDAGGKTGTSEDAGVWFSGFAPSDNPKWVISVYIADGSSGGTEAALVFHEIIDDLAILEGI